MSPATDTNDLTKTLRELRELVNNLLIVLSPKEKQIIEQRFSLNSSPRATLEKIGKDFGVTRERIRQIEKNALRKLQRNVNNTKLHIVNQHANTILQKYEGVVLEERLVNDILNLVADQNGIDVSSIKLSLQLDQNMEKVHNTISYRPYWKFKMIPRKEVQDVCDATVSYLNTKSDVVPYDELLSELQQKLPKRVSKQFVASCLEID